MLLGADKSRKIRGKQEGVLGKSFFRSMKRNFLPGFTRRAITFYRKRNRELKQRAGEMSGKRKASKKFIHIGEVLQQTLKSCRRETNETLAALGACWPDVVGEALGMHSCPAAMKGKQLLVHVSSSVWLQEMRFLKDDLVDAVNRLPGGPFVEDIRFKVGKV
jgi:hypothetical protein